MGAGASIGAEAGGRGVTSAVPSRPGGVGGVVVRPRSSGVRIRMTKEPPSMMAMIQMALVCSGLGTGFWVSWSSAIRTPATGSAVPTEARRKIQVGGSRSSRKASSM